MSPKVVSVCDRSSSTVAGAAYVGGDLSPNYHRKTIGVAKAIMSRVGFGPFASEFGGLESENCMEEGGNHNRDYEERTYDTTAYLQSENPFKSQHRPARAWS